ncbi:unnamed protein product [Adineta steineri]|uniref:Uncharacterized protein n=1 Tax=Adineta steineri TaxID=433720 RepID=A0A815SJX8_9BILA|nr:unnamed protein product [Adineta steineri]CAF1489856.1 unnamed protein product [Adineta steineri]
MNFIAGLRTIKEYLSSLNLFESSAGLTNPNRLRAEIISTRIYIVLANIAVFILLLFTALEHTTQSITIRNPSQDTFERYYSEYLTRLQSEPSTTFQCSCSQVEIPYKTFINISYKLHPVCSSVFISDSWVNLLFSPDMTYYYPFDFRSSGNGQFQLLASLCLFASQTLNNAIDDFLSNFLLSPLLTRSSTSFKIQNEVSAEFLKTSAIYTFRRLLNLMSDTTEINSLQPAMQTASMELLDYYSNGTMNAYPYQTIWPGDYNGECFCGITNDCYAQASFFDDAYAYETQGAFYPPDSSGNVTGFLIGCYAFDALLNSSLTCFFDSICLSNILTYFPTINITGDDILNINQTKFEPNTTIEMLANNLFIEDWSIESSFGFYYSKCAPILCIYKYAERNSFLQVLTTLLGVYGGLTVALRMCIPHAVRFWRNRKIPNRIQPNRVTILQRLRNAQNTVKNKIIELNLFKTAAARTNPYELKTTRIMTYVYLITMLLALSIVTIYLLASIQVRTETIQNPSQMIFENLNEKYMSTLQCPCNSIANSYDIFTSISPTFHPICSSLFISNEWIVSLSDMNIIDAAYDPTDFRVAGPFFFNAMKTLCSLSNATTHDAWYEFSQSLLVTDLVVSDSEFKNRIQAVFEQFQETTLYEFKRILSLVDLHTRTLYNTGFENVDLYTDQLATSTSQIDFGWEPVVTETCSCTFNGQCTDVMSFFYYTNGLTTDAPYYLNFTISDLQIGCYVLPSALNSSLSCFFNQTCLDMIQNELESARSIDIKILDINSTHFPPHTRIQIILDNLMIEKWNENISYEKYYEVCAPEQCTYTYTSRNNPVQTITTLIGLFGGLSVALKIIVSMIVRRIRNRMRPHEETNIVADQPATVRNATNIWRILKTKLLKLNLFESELSWDDDQRRQREIIITRVYLLFLMAAVAILVIYTFIETQTKIVTIPKPSQNEFDQLRLNPQYSTTLDCPCKSITVPYNSFISIKPYYHQLCSSDFVVNNSIWISLLYSFTAGIDYSYDDYRLFASSHFQLLSGLCSLANDTVNAAITEFSRNTIINEIVQSEESIKAQTDIILSQFLLSTPRTFTLNLDFIRYINQGNGIVSSIFSNWHFVSLDTGAEYDALWAVPHSYNDNSCICGASSTCISKASFNGITIPGLHVGCYPLESLLQSTLECLYNITCINQLKSMYTRSNITFNPLNDTLSTRNATVQSIVNNLLVERWQTEVVYGNYYAACDPLWCTYTFDGQISPIYTITTIIGLYGGLTVVFKLMVPIIVRIGYYIIRYRHRRVTPVVTIMTINKPIIL